MEQEGVVEGPGYRLMVQRGPRGLSWRDREVRVGSTLLELDADFGFLGEAVAGLLLPRVRVEGEWLERVVERYRVRVVAEQAADLATRLGRLALEALVDPAFFPLSRMTLYWGVNGCFYRDSWDPEGLRSEYEGLVEAAGDMEGSGVRLRPARYREVIQSYASRLRAAAGGLLARASTILAPGEAWPGRSCGPGEPPGDPGGLVRLPEGRVYYSCPGARGLAEAILGAGASCRRPSWTASSFVCESPRGRIVVKEYYKMIVKWLPAALASARSYGYILTPKKRMYNEYRYLVELRRIVETPRILAVCGDQARAVMAREYVEGEPVLGSRDPGAWRASGEALARIHSAGYALGDPNPGNFVVSPRGVAVVDAEQAKRYSERRGAWDLAVYTVYALLFREPEELVAEGLRAYRSAAPGLAEREAGILRDPGFWAPLAVLGPVAAQARGLLARYL